MAIINVKGRKPRVSGSDGHGYGGVTPGKRTPTLPNGMKSETGNVMYENEFNRAVEKYYGEELRRCGFDYLSVAPGDADTSLATRADRSDAFDADFHLDIHANAFKGTWGAAKGIEVFYYGGSKQSIEAAKVIHKHLMGGTPFVDRGVKDGSGLYMLRNTNAVAALAELGFMDNVDDVRHLLSDSYRRECAEELAKATCEIFGMSYVPKVAPAPKPSGAYHTIKSGDTLWSIAQDNGFTVAQLQAWNPTLKADALQVGQHVHFGSATKPAPKPAPKPVAKPAPAPKKEYAYFPPGHGNWSVYPLTKAPVKANAVGAINPSKFGGLTYQVLGKPYPNVVTIQTGDFGRVNIFVGDPNSKLIWK